MKHLFYILLFIPSLAFSQFGVKAYCDDCCDCFEDAKYKLYNVGGVTNIRVASWEDSNTIWINDDNTTFDIDKDQVLELSSNEGDIIYSCEPIFSSGELGSSHRGLVPEYTANDVLGTTASRYGGIQIKLYSLSATSADIFRNGVLVNTIPLTVGAVSTFNQTGNYTGNWKVVANGEVLGFKSEDTPFNGDASVMVRPSTDIIGWASTSSYVAKESGSVGSFTFDTYSHLGNYTGTIATTYNIVNSADLPHTTTQSRYYDQNSNLRFISRTSEGLYANSRADSDGGDDTPFLPIDILKTHHKIPQPSEFVAISTIGSATVEVRDAAGILITTLTTTKVNTDPLAPYAVRYGTPNGLSNIPAGYEFIGSEGLNIVYQPKGAGLFGSDDDETVSWGYNL